MTEQNEPSEFSKRPLASGLKAAIGFVVIFILIWGAYRINALTQDLKKIQEESKVNTQQLINFNQILGHALDIQSENPSPSPIDIKASLEVFEKLNSLSFHLESLKVKIGQQTQERVEKKPITSESESSRAANAEMRWWSKVGHYLLAPIQSYFYQLIKVQVTDSTLDQLAMTEYSQQLLRQEMVVRSLSARTLLLNGLVSNCKNEVQLIKNAIEKNFLPNDPNTQIAMEEIEFILNNLHDIEKKQVSNTRRTGDKK